jgi:glutamine amidotransferase
MIAVVDYCKGNLKSVERGLCAAGGDAQIVDNPVDIAHADAIVLPGVGAFDDAATYMAASGQMTVIRDSITTGTPFLGICLGMHLLFEHGVEGSSAATGTDGLGIIPGTVQRMPSVDTQGTHYKIPHVGWNTVDYCNETALPLCEGIDDHTYFYFTHSYISPRNPYTQAATEHSVAFPSIVDYHHRVFGVQFHPEKSSDAGARVLKNFVDLVAHIHCE